MAQVTLKGNPIHTNGELPAVGAKAPDFRLTGGDLKDVSLADYKGKRKILNIVPSLDTAVCATSTRKFNEKAGQLANTVVLVVSADLPFAAKRFCTTEGLQNVVPLSLMRDKKFAKDYGVLHPGRPARRALRPRRRRAGLGRQGHLPPARAGDRAGAGLRPRALARAEVMARTG